MSLQIITNKPNLSNKLTHILTHYFPSSSSSSNPCLLQIDTKYYTCTVPIKVTPFAGQVEEEGKVDVVLFVFDEGEDVEEIREGIDGWVGRLRPESVMVCVSTGKEKGEEEWRYAGEVAACENFVSVVYEKLDEVEEKWPQWHANGGLLQEQNQQSEIFSLLQLLQTTSWSNSNPKIQPKNPENPAITSTKPNPPSTASKQQQEQDKQQQQQQYEPTEQQLQKQMLEFQLLMQQMMQIKSLPVAGNQRKKKAEDLITQLARNFKD